MDCDELVELVTDYLEGTLAAVDTAALEHHLERCDGCEAYLQQMRTTIALSGRLTPGDVPPHAMDRLLDVFRSTP
jgi:predicted anti-sigma-YlaC factor YlaD